MEQMTKKKTKKNNEVFIHIGLGRSGSDFLQKKIFPNLKGIQYVDRYNSKKFNQFRIKNFYDPHFNINNKSFYKTNKKILFSSENFFNPEFDLNSLIKKIRFFDYKPRLIIILRNPFDHLISTYKYSVKNSLIWKRLDEHFYFGKTKRARNVTPDAIFFETFYNYKLLITNLKLFFNVEVFYFEKVFKSYSSMNNFIVKISKLTKSKFNNRFKIKDFKKINQSLKDNSVRQKRIKNFKISNKIILKTYKVSDDYFEKIYTVKFKKKFSKLIKYKI
tara:strand:- start:13 stop:837 length:825 start_codon:yes stop_codon:yes gene_type:complete